MTTHTPGKKTVFYIPAGVPFLNALAEAILSGELSNGSAPTLEELPTWTVLLPTRRATRALMQAFVDQSKGNARLLPRIQPLGDVEEDELALSSSLLGLDVDALPDAISGLERQFILFDLIHDWVRDHMENPLAKMLNDSAVHAFDLARSLASLVDSFETNNIDLKIIETLFDGEFAEHRQEILSFLSLVHRHLPERIAGIQKIGSSERRNRLMLAHTEFLTQGKACGPIIAAGSTGSIPATAQLLSCIAGMENGAVILPGLDKTLDEESWDCLPEHHPQFGMRELLEKMHISRDDVVLLPGVVESPSTQTKNWLASEIMRPAETTDKWREAVTQSRQKLLEATNDITVLDAEDQREEATAISLIMRNGLEEGQSVALVTPDRQLARNVKTEVARWAINIDDSAGQPLSQTPHASLMRLLLEATKSNFSPVSLKTLLAHPLSCFATPENQRFDLFAKFEIALLRAGTTYDGLDGLCKLCEKQINDQLINPYLHPSVKRLDDNDWQAISDLSNRLVEILQPIADLTENRSPSKLINFITCHLQVAETACRTIAGQCSLWDGDAGEKLSEVFSNLQSAAHLAPLITVHEYTLLVEQQLSEAVVRPNLTQHGSLAIYGLLEARMISADVVILGGLNETVWPQVAEIDPWLTRPQLRSAGLPVPERRVGLSAHDFAQGFCSKKVYLTYSKKMGNSPAVPSRWILRLNALLEAANATQACSAKPQYPWLDWARQLDKPESFHPSKRPSPKPPVNLRPVSFSVSGINTLMKDPYAFYADKILKLKPLNPLNYQVGPAERGNLVHAALQHFIQSHQSHLPEDANQLLLAEFEKQSAQSIPDTTLRILWKPQFVRMADWFIEQETLLRQNQVFNCVEISGQYTFNISSTTYQLSARADRLDMLNDNTVRIIDYKTGMLPAFRETNKAFSPQLLLEAVICSHGGFKDIKATAVSYLAYMKLSGGIPAGQMLSNPDGLDTLMEKTESGMKSLLSSYSEQSQPYLAKPEPARPDHEFDYDYLSRWREWAHLTDDENVT